MKSAKKIFKCWAVSTTGMMVLFAALCSTGCTVHTNGMTIPSAEWMNQRVQYFPTGPQYPLTQERAMMEKSKPETKDYYQSEYGNY